MKKKFIILTLCFTIIFSSINFKKSYADGGVVSLPMLAAISSLAVGTGIVISGNDDLFDIGRIFYDYINNHNSLTWATVQSVFASSVSLQPNKFVSVESEFLDIVKEFFDNTFGSSVGNIIYSKYGIPVWIDKGMPIGSLTAKQKKYYIPNVSTLGFSSSDFYIIPYGTKGIEYGIYGKESKIIELGFELNYPLRAFYYNGLTIFDFNGNSVFTGQSIPAIDASNYDIPYTPGSYNWDNVDSKKENGSIALPIPGDLSTLVGQGSTDFWDNADNLVGQGGLVLPGVDSPSISVDTSINTFPGVDTDVPGVESPSVPNEGIWATIKDFIIGLVVPSDTFWTDTWGGLYNNFTDSFPMVDMSGFNDLVTGEKKFPNIDINIMGITGRVVNGDVINSIVDWLRPIIAGFMMICLMLFNYRKIYKLIRNTEPFGGIAPGTSDFKTGISEYTHVGLVNDGFKRSEEEEFARSRYYEEMHFRNGGKL